MPENSQSEHISDLNKLPLGGAIVQINIILPIRQSEGHPIIPDESSEHLSNAEVFGKIHSVLLPTNSPETTNLPP